MPAFVRHPASAVWLLLVAGTVTSWWFAAEQAANAELHPLRTTLLLMAIAFIKVRFAIMHFMELRHAAAPLRWLADAWCVAAAGSILGIYVVN